MSSFQSWVKRKCERDLLDFYDLKKPHDETETDLISYDFEWTIYEKSKKVSTVATN